MQHIACTIQVQSVTPCGDFYESFFFTRAKQAAAAKQVIQWSLGGIFIIQKAQGVQDQNQAAAVFD